MSSLKSKLRDAADIMRRARSVPEALKALVPPTMLARRVLNDGGTDAPAGTEPGDDLALELKRIANIVKAEAISEDGTRVDYAGLRNADAFRQLEHASSRLRSFDPATLRTDAERIAFWVNLYNVLTVHGIVALGIRNSVMEIPSFFGTVAYRIGPHTFTPDDIENGVLRRNGRHPATKRRVWSDDDPRLACAPARVDARIHVALVCAARGCPPIGFYTPERLEDELELAAASFVNNDLVVHDDRRVIELSAIFRYYPDDFGGDEGVKRFLSRYAEGELGDAVRRAVDAGYALEHRPYDWDLNAA